MSLVNLSSPLLGLFYTFWPVQHPLSVSHNLITPCANRFNAALELAISTCSGDAKRHFPCERYFSSALPHEGSCLLKLAGDNGFGGEGDGASHHVADEQEEIVRYCQRGAAHLVLPGTGTIKKSHVACWTPTAYLVRCGHGNTWPIYTFSGASGSWRKGGGNRGNALHLDFGDF